MDVVAVDRVETKGLEQSLGLVVSTLSRARRVLLTMHENPDGDALGSALALAAALREMGREAVVYSPQGAPDYLTFLPGADRIVRSIGPSESFDATVACDAGHPSRLGPEVPQDGRRGVFVNLDHHATTPFFGDVNYIDIKASAVGVLVARVLRQMGHRVSRDVATCIWVSLVSDTGNFRHSNTDPETLRLAAELVESGVRVGDITSRLHDSQPVERLKLLSEVLRTLSLAAEGRIAWLTATQEQYDRAGTDKETSEGFINYPRSIAGVEVALFFREDGSGKTRVSFRSRGNVDVGAIAIKLGGGGHRNASGVTLPGDVGPVSAQVVQAVELAMAAAAN